ncbi:MAG: hypothetical protein ACI9MC_000901 [Kiritimatiellia bacterium]|jgi:hypothetical protein
MNVATRLTLALPLLFGGCHRLDTGVYSLGDRSADYAMYVPEGDGAYRVAVLLPGDGWSARDLPRKRALRTWADAHHTIVVSVAPPNQSRCWWTPGKHERAAFLLEFLQDRVLSAYQVDLRRVDLGGWSGGAFLAFGMPFYVDLPFDGGLVGVCGADVPRVQSSVDYCGDDLSDDEPMSIDVSGAADLLAGKRVSLARTTGDDLVGVMDAGLAFYKGLGAATRVVDEGPGDHCDFDVVDAIIDGLNWIEAGR